MSGEISILEEIAGISEFGRHMPPVGFYLAGCARSRTNVAPKVILNFVKSFYEKVELGAIEQCMKDLVQVRICRGEIGTAKNLIKSAEENFKESQRALQLESSRLNDELDKLINKVHNYRCSMCESEIQEPDLIILQTCRHAFHRICCNMLIENQVYSNRHQIRCTQEGCFNQLNFNEICRYSSKEVVSYFNNQQVEPLLNKCKNCLVQINAADTCFQCKQQVQPSVICPNCKISNYKGRKRVVHCIACGYKICGECGLSLIICKCSAKIWGNYKPQPFS